MKNTNIENALFNIDEKYLDKSLDFDGLSTSFKKEKRKRFSAVCAVCCMAICLTALGINQVGLFNGRNLVSPEEKITNNSEIYLEPSWEERGITSKFPAITFNNVEYVAVNSEKSIPITENTNKKIGNQAVTATDYLTDKKHSINALIYSLQDISSDCIIAVKFEGYEGVYSYMNTGYNISTLGDLIVALNLENTLSFGNIEDVSARNEQSKLTYALDSQNYIWEYLLSHTDAKDLGDIDIEPLFDITVNISMLGINNKALIISNDGYIQTNILEVAHTFYVGKEAVEDFKSYASTLPSNTVSTNIDDAEIEILE